MVREVAGGGNHYPASPEEKQRFNLKRPEETAGSNKYLQGPGEVMQGGADPPFQLENFTFKEPADSTGLFAHLPDSLAREALSQMESFLYLILQ